MSDEVYPPEAKLGIFEAMVAETDILVSLDPNVPGVLLPPKLMTDGPVTIKVSLAADPEIVCDADGFVYEMPMGFQAVIPWESVFRLAELDQPENQAWWEADDPATKEFMSAFDESFGDLASAQELANEELFERTLKGVGAPPPPNPNKRPEPVETDPRAIDMRARLDALEFERTKNRKHLEAQATLRGQLKVVSGRTKEEPPTEVRTGHLKLVR